jgi:hypothetical protein
MVGFGDRPWAMLLPWAWIALPSLAVGLVAGELVGAIWGHRFEGDWLLWRPGAFELLETARLLRREGEVLLSLGPWAVLAYSLLGLAPWAAAVVAFARPEVTGPAARLARAVERVPALTFVYGLGLVGRVLGLLVGLAIGGLLAPAISGPSLQLEAAIKVVAALVAALLVAVVRVWHDLATAAAVRHQSGGREASITALSVLRSRFPRAMIGWGARLAAGAALVALAALATGSLSLASSRSVALVLLIHQLVIGALVALRCAWLADAVELVGRPLFADFFDEEDAPSPPEPASLESREPASPGGSEPPAAPGAQ